MKTRKTVIAVLAAVLLISAALIVGCMNQIELPINGEENYTPPEGKGVIRLKISDNNARTILPTAPVTGLFFDIEFTDSDGPPNKYYISNTGTIVTSAPVVKPAYSVVNITPFALTAETYTLKVTAYAEAAGTNVVAGYNHPTSIIVTGSSSHPIQAVLVALVDGTQSGDFDYNVTIPTDSSYSTKKMTITRYNDTINFNSTSPGSTLSTTGIILNDDGTAKIGTQTALPSGYYFVTVTLSKTGYLTKEYTESLHIYPGKTSTWTVDFSAASLLKNVFTVTYKKNYGAPETDITEPVNYAKLASGSTTFTESGYDVEGWYTASTTLPGEKWDTATKKVLGDIDLYAKWDVSATPGVAITITFNTADKIDGTSITGGSRTINVTGTVSGMALDGTNQVVLIVGAPIGGGTWSSIEWEIAGISTIAPAAISGTGDNTLTIKNDSNFEDVLIPGTFTVTVKAYMLLDAIPYTVGIPITVAP
jgi:uncharacterized repeat protein (TIGR02543 family)